MRRFKGIIALDIDGTITIEKHRIEKKVEDFLNFLIEDGWQLIFLTGRTFSFAFPILSGLKGEFYFAPQNGAALYKMPEQRQLTTHYLSTCVLPKLPPKMLVESGKDHDDICYYCPEAFTQKELEYIHFRIEMTPEKWVALGSFNELKISEFAVGKCFGEVPQLELVNVTVIRDPFNPGNHLAFVNAADASKGEMLEEFRRMHPPELPAIAAGDDFNDVGMLEKSTFKIVMQNAPEKMHALADLLAKSAHDHGIIDALKEATSYYGRND